MEINNSFRPWGLDKKSYIIFMHLAQFAGTITAGLGFVLPLVMWLVFKDEDQTIDEHGKKIVNWSISMFIYFIIAGLACFILIGIPIVFALVIIGFVLPIIGALRASNGELYNYPLTIKFL